MSPSIAFSSDCTVDVGSRREVNEEKVNPWKSFRASESGTRRAHTFDRWLNRYNCHRHHTAIGGPFVVFTL
jgi:hypothetical protein